MPLRRDRKPNIAVANRRLGFARMVPPIHYREVSEGALMSEGVRGFFLAQAAASTENFPQILEKS